MDITSEDNMDITPELHLCQHLASNEPRIRDKALRDVAEYISTKSLEEEYTEEEMHKLWKGLFYYFWHCDKPLVQEEKAKFISDFIHLFKNEKHAILFVDVYFQTMCREWHAIDIFRLDKFLMLSRQVMRQGYEFLKKRNWNIESIDSFLGALMKTVANADCDEIPVGMKTHITDIYLDELAKVGSEELTPELVQKFIEPYCSVLTTCDNFAFVQNVKKDIFQYLINQPETDGQFPVLKFDATCVQNLLREHINSSSLTKRHLKNIYRIIKSFQDYIDGVDITAKILQTKKGRGLSDRDIKRAAKRLLEQDEEFAEIKAQFKKSKKNQPDIIDL